MALDKPTDQPPVENWDVWFDKQYELRAEIKQAMQKYTEGHSPHFKAAILSGVLEEVAEEMRMYLVLPDGT